MCSIEGTSNPNFDISKFTDINKTRGPDGTDFYKDDNVNLGHNLLEISPNPKRKVQPFVTSKGNVLVYNGEIYGLKRYIGDDAGIEMDDVWDVEWLAHKIENEGIDSLANGVNGMWALAWYEPSKSKITLCRDHFGIKPLYYSFIQDHLYFSSTIIPLVSTKIGFNEMPEWDDTHKDLIYKNTDGFNPGRLTPVLGINKLYPGQILEIDVNTNQPIKWGSLWKDYNLKPNFLWDKWELDKFMTRYISEVCNAPNIKKTLSLSGGLDSSLIASIARNKDKMSASSVHWEDVNIKDKDPSRHMMNEIKLSKETTKWLGMDHYVAEIPFDNKEVHDEVFTSMFGIPTWDIQRLLPRFYNITQAAKNGNKVYISGDCADEILTGYNGDFKLHSHGVNLLDTLNHQLGYTTKPVEEMDMANREVGRIINKKILGSDNINNRQFHNLLYHSDGFCTVLDHMCGYYGMESRVPFLHQELVKYLMKIPGQQKLYINDDRIPGKDLEEKRDYKFFMMGHYKGILRDSLSHHYVPNVRERMRKTGFSNPWNARDADLNKKLRDEQYEIQKRKLSEESVDFKDNLLYNLYHEIKTEKVNE